MKNLAALCLLFLAACQPKDEEVVIYVIGDSTVANYADNYEEGKDYFKTRYPVAGWGQLFQEYFTQADLTALKPLLHVDSVRIDDRARGGRSTRTFFQEGRWRKVYEVLQPGDLVMMQFGHNDGSEAHPLRYVDIEGYKEFLRLFVDQTREKGATPIILTPVARNYPWENGQLQNVHGEYPQAAQEVATEMNVLFIDLNQLSIQAFTEKGEDFVSREYFMNLDSGVYEAYPNGQSDNTHFQIEGGRFVAGLVFEAMKDLKP